MRIINTYIHILYFRCDMSIANHEISGVRRGEKQRERIQIY